VIKLRKSKGLRSGTRRLLSKKPGERGKINLSKILHNYKPGDRVCVKIDPSIHKGMPHKRYHGKIGIIKNRKGRSYVLEVGIGGGIKEIIARPEHVKPHKG
jgi:large subunit ribosomal protein L21e